MSATLLGTTGTWGIADAETSLGLIVETMGFSYKNEKKPVKNISGDTQGKSYYDEQVDISLKGMATSSTPFSGKLTASLSLANTIPVHLQATQTGGLIVIEDIKNDLSIEDWVKYDIGGVLYPYL